MINVKRYIINYTKLVTERLPDVEIRTDEVLAYCLVLVSPLVLVYNSLLTFRLFLLYKLSITPQVCYLEKMLNNQYDNTERRIYIEDAVLVDGIFIFQEAEEEPIFIYTEAESTKPKTYLYTEGETSGAGANDFIVFYPAGLLFNMNELVSLVNQYKLASKKFTVQPYV